MPRTIPYTLPAQSVVIDFDWASFFDPGEPKQEVERGAAYICAPELFVSQYSPQADPIKSDAWAIGASIFYFIYGRKAYGADYDANGQESPWTPERYFVFMAEVRKYNKFPFPSVPIPFAKSLDKWGVNQMIGIMKKFMTVSPDARPSPGQIVEEYGLLRELPQSHALVK